VHQHQKELNVLQEQFQSILQAKDDQINDLVYRVKKGSQHHSEQQETSNAGADDMNNEVQSFIYLNYTM